MSTPTLPEALALLAAAVATCSTGDFPIRATAYPPTGGDRRPGDAWCIPPRVSPATFADARAELQAVLVLAADPATASRRFAELAVPVMNAATRVDGLPLADVEVTPESLLAGDNVTGALYVLTLTATAEVA